STVSGFTPSSSTFLANSTAASYTDANVTAGTTYFYVVTGLNTTGQESAPSGQASAKPQQALAPTPPGNVTATGGVLQIQLSWTTGTNVTSYNVYRSTVSGFTIASSNLIGNTTALSYTDTSVTAGTTYYYLVTGVNTTQESPPSNQASATAQGLPPPSPPTGLTASGSILN